MERKLSNGWTRKLSCLLFVRLLEASMGLLRLVGPGFHRDFGPF